MDEAGKEVDSLRGVAGLSLFSAAGTGPGRKTFASQNGRAFVVSGAGVYEIAADGTPTLRGTLLQTQGNLTIVENTVEMAICDGRKIFLFTYATNSFAVVTDPDLPDVGTVTVMDGYFIANELDTGRFYISGINNGAAWNALDFATAETAPDDLRACVRALGQLWLLGETTSEVWSNTGAADFPFRRIQGSAFNVGVLSPYTALEVGDSFLWLGKSDLGSGVVYLATGLLPRRVSTSPIEQIIQRAPDSDQCTAHAYHADGHWFYVLTGGGLETSLVLDLTTMQWHERAQLNDQGAYEQHIVKDLMFAFGKHLGVDRRSGRIYRMSQDLYDNAGEVRSCERIFTHLSDEDKRVVYNRLAIGVEAGVGLADGQGSDPLLSLRLSKDGAKTWSTWFTTTIGKIGKTRNKAAFRRLGVAEQMTFNIRITDPVKVDITGGYLT
jgi:hypothetical protein